jgi:agmatinase
MPLRSLTTFRDVPYVPPGQDIDSIDADVVIQGAPSDLATSGRPGTRFGPDAVRVASRALLWEERRWPWDFVLNERLRIVDRGNIDFPAGHLAEMAKILEAETAALIRAGHHVFTIGGDHYVTLPLLRAHHSHYGPLALVQFDAHTDTDVREHDHHGVMFHLAAEEGLLDLDHSIQVGVRTYYEPQTHKFEVLDADWANNNGPQAIAERIRAVVGERPIYLSFDIDCLDPAFAPGTGTPVVCGLSSSLAMQALRQLSGHLLVGVDLVEISPPYDPSGITALGGATIALELLYLMACKGC